MAKTSLSIVIPTIGEALLQDTIKSIMASSFLPDEILLSIPDDKQHLVGHLKDNNPLVKVLPSKVKGQVAQRLLGFQAAKGEYVLQLDSDIVLAKDCIANLMNHICQRKKLAVGPALFNYKTNAYISYLVPGVRPLTKLEETILYFLANGSAGFQAGKISQSGINFGVPQTDSIQTVEWLPGCCVLHRRENLILHDFYPFSGKAYAEDLFHSQALAERNIVLCSVGTAKILVKSPFYNFTDFMFLLKEQLQFARTIRVFNRKYKKSMFRFYCFWLANIIILIRQKIWKIDRKNTNA